MRRGLTTWAIAVRMLCALALLSTGFAHKPVFADPVSSSAAFAAYALPDGSLPIFCVTDTGAEPDKGQHAGQGHCDACRLSASTLLPAPPVDPAPGLTPASSARPQLPQTSEPASIFEPNRAPRAPPFLLPTA